MNKKNTTIVSSESKEPVFGYSFLAVKGVQAGKEYFVSMCPLRSIPKIFLFNSEELPPDIRAQRRLNRTRLPEIINYIVNNPEDYVLSAITASIDGETNFMPFKGDGELSRHGVLNVSFDARFIINDGQHRRAAIEKALLINPDLGEETIAVVFFLDPKLQRCQQIFADLNRYAIRPSKSLGILYDFRDGKALLTKQLLKESKIFKNLVEPEKSTLSSRSRRLFTLSAIYGATNDLLAGMDKEDEKELIMLAADYWEMLAKAIKEWGLVYNRRITAGELRQDYICSHGVVLQAMGRSGNTLIQTYPKDWKKRLKGICKINWKRDNPIWEGRALIGGRVSKAQQNVTLVTNYLKNHLGLQLSPEERKTEESHKRGI